jgi:hypothetical protein
MAGSSSSEATVAQALEMARDSDEAGRNPEITRILEIAIDEIWRKVGAAPHTYIMSKGEFAVFTYFAARYASSPLAAAARSRYWETLGRLR